MKIYSTAPEGNEAADLENARYFNLALKQINSASQWKESFYAWFELVNSKIPQKYRQGIKESADALFTELDQYGH